MNIRRREFLIAGVSAIAAACGSNSSPTSPSTTTPLIALLQRDGYAVEEQRNQNGGVILRINGKLQQIKVGTKLVGIDEAMGFDSATSGLPNLNMAQYPVPSELGYVLVA